MTHAHDEPGSPEPTPRAKAERLSARGRILPAEALLHEPQELHPYECDGLSAYRRLPLPVALPERVDQVQAILPLRHERQVPVVARGAGTGLSGGALPVAHRVL